MNVLKIGLGSMFCVVLLGASGSLPDPLAAGWDGQSVCEALHDTSSLRVLRCTFAPGGGQERHYHAPHFGYALSGGRMQLNDVSGEREVSLSSDSFFASGGVDWHEVYNIGETTVSYLIVEPRAEHTEPPEPSSWLAGHWCGGDDARGFEEMWMPAVQGESVGIGRTLRDGKTVSVEHLRITQIDGVSTLIARPDGQDSVPFTQTASGPTWVRFENPTHDFPKMIEYRRDGAGLKASISDGTDERRHFEFARCASKR